MELTESMQDPAAHGMETLSFSTAVDPTACTWAIASRFRAVQVFGPGPTFHCPGSLCRHEWGCGTCRGGPAFPSKPCTDTGPEGTSGT